METSLATPQLTAIVHTLITCHKEIWAQNPQLLEAEAVYAANNPSF
jgi:hypothetical protein